MALAGLTCDFQSGAELLQCVLAMEEAIGSAESGSDISTEPPKLLAKVISLLPPSNTSFEDYIVANRRQTEALICALSDLALRVQDTLRFRYRVRTAALRALELGLVLVEGGSDDIGTRVLRAAASASNDEQWQVRASGIRAAGAFLQGRNERLVTWLGMKEACWLPAMLVDNFPQVQESARQALCLYAVTEIPKVTTTDSTSPARPLATHKTLSDDTPPHASPPSSNRLDNWAELAMVAACEVLEARARNTLTVHSRDDTVDAWVGEGGERTVRRALQAICGLASEPLAPRPQPALVARALNAVVVWLEGVVKSPPGSPPLMDRGGGDLAGVSRSLVRNIRVTVQALGACARWGTRRIAHDRNIEVLNERRDEEEGYRGLLRSMEEVIGVFCEACSKEVSAQSEGEVGAGEGEEQGEEEWQGIYCALLVWLEAACPGGGWGRLCAGDEPKPVPVSSPRQDSSLGQGLRGGEGLTIGNDMASNLHNSLPRAQSPGHSTRQDTFFHTWALGPLVAAMAIALATVPHTYECLTSPPPKWTPRTGDDKEQRQANLLEREHRLGWLVASVHLILTTLITFCREGAMVGVSPGNYKIGAVSQDDVRGDGDQRGLAQIIPALLVAVLPLLESSTESDFPVLDWLNAFARTPSSTDLHPPHNPLGGGPRIDSDIVYAQMGDDRAETKVEGSSRGGVGGEGCEIELLLAPVPWKHCLRWVPQRHAIPAPWAGDPQTRLLASELIGAACALGTDQGGGVVTASRRESTGEGSGGTPDKESPPEVAIGEYLSTSRGGVEALTLALRAAIREQGGWREGSSVGIKHAIARAVRCIRFPLADDGDSNQVLGHILPLALPLVDDYDAAHQALGFSLLLHVFAEATTSELAPYLELLHRALLGGLSSCRDPVALALCFTAEVRLLRSAPPTVAGESFARRAGLKVVREAVALAGRASDVTLLLVCVIGLAAAVEVPAVTGGFALCELLRPLLLCLLPILQSPGGFEDIDARPAALRALLTLCRYCWPCVPSHVSKLLCSLLWTCADAQRHTMSLTPKALTAGSGEVEEIGGECCGTCSHDRETVSIDAFATASSAAVAEVTLLHATRLGALVLVLSGEAGKSVLEGVCGAVEALESVGLKMEMLASCSVAFKRDGYEDKVWRQGTHC